MLHYCMNGSSENVGGCSEMTIECQQHQSGFNAAAADSGSELAEVVALSIKPPPPSAFDLTSSSISRTYSCPPSLIEPKATTDSPIAKQSNHSKKRKHSHKVVGESDNKEKKIKVGAEDGESKITGQSCSKINTTTANSNNGETCVDYIHVRARRGQATDSHSLAERVRREKISERMKFLQDLVPGCNKITGKAGMLDEIINYVQSLQRQVEFLSMKLAAVNPRLDFNVDDLVNKEVFPACVPTFPNIGEMNNPSYLHYNSPHQIVSYTGINTSDMGLRRTLSAPVSMPETFLDSSYFQQIIPSSIWESEFQNLYNMAFDQERATNFPSQLFTGLVEAGNLKMEM